MGNLGLYGDQARLEFNSEFDRSAPVAAGSGERLAIDPEWLKWIPAGQAVAVASLATGRDSRYWDGAFALADRVDRADPARANLAPLRTGSICWRRPLGPDSRRTSGPISVASQWPGWPSLVNSTGQDAQWWCCRWMIQGPPSTYLQTLCHAWRPSGEAGNSIRGRHNRGSRMVFWSQARIPGDPMRGASNGRPIEAAVVGRTLLIGWGDQALETMLSTAEHPELSVKPLFGRQEEALRGNR